jgi:cytidyltransferase-like protein
MKVVLTAAIMDVFHEGHANVLRQMRSRGDKVIVVLHDDLSCFKIKDKFPMQTVQHRRRNVLLSGLADEVFITASVDPSDQFELVIAKHNDILFLRGDDNKYFPGKRTIDAYAIPIEFISYTEGVSSTQRRETVRGLDEYHVSD